MVLSSGHGAPGRLMVADGPVSAEWLACMMHQAPRGVVLAHGVAVALVAMEVPAMAGAAFLLPGLVNGYSRIEKRLGAIEGRLSRIERGLGIKPAG